MVNAETVRDPMKNQEKAYCQFSVKTLEKITHNYQTLNLPSEEEKHFLVYDQLLGLRFTP